MITNNRQHSLTSRRGSPKMSGYSKLLCNDSRLFLKKNFNIALKFVKLFMLLIVKRQIISIFAPKNEIVCWHTNFSYCSRYKFKIVWFDLTRFNHANFQKKIYPNQGGKKATDRHICTRNPQHEI